MIQKKQKCFLKITFFSISKTGRLDPKVYSGSSLQANDVSHQLNNWLSNWGVKTDVKKRQKSEKMFFSTSKNHNLHPKVYSGSSCMLINDDRHH